MKKVITYGTFDLLHYGHLRLLKRAKQQGDYLIVGLSTDKFNKEKGKQSLMDYHERELSLLELPFVDEIIPEHDWEQKFDDIQNNNVSMFVMGDDWKGKFDELDFFCKVKYISRTPRISTSIIKKRICKH